MMSLIADKSSPFPQRRLRVVHLVSSLNIGGLEMLVWNLARFTDQSRFDVRVICLAEPGELASRFAPLGIPVEALYAREGHSGRTLLRLRKRLRALRPNVLHMHNPSPHLFGTIAGRLARVPVLINTKHGRNRTDLPRQVKLNRLLSYFSTRIVPVSEDAAAVARDLERVSPSRLTLIRNGVDVDAFSSLPAAHPSGKIAIHVARLNLIKDQNTLLRAARIVRDAEPEFRLNIVGDGPSRDELFSLHRELNLHDCVQFLGFRDDVRELLAQADLFVLSSLSEGISLTLLEAMAMRLPVVATAVGGNGEVVANGETGLLVQPQSPEKMAEAMLTLLRDPARSRKMGIAGRQRVENEFNLRQVARKYESLYEQLCEGDRQSKSG